MPAREPVEENLSEGEDEKHLSDETVEEESIARWPVSATGDEYSRGDLVDLPISKEEV
jgi:hypothetical protein